MTRHAHIDGDVLVYQTGFGSDSVAKKARKEAGFALVGDEHEPIEFQLHGTAEKIRSLMRKAEADTYTIWISHPVNDRERIYPEYKANRNDLHKPFWYEEIKQYLFDNKGALYSAKGDEADDAMGIAQMAAIAKDEDSIIVTIDKDLDMIPGLHYNFSKTKEANGIYDVEDPEGLRVFYRSMIQGDVSDNIPGLLRSKGEEIGIKKVTSRWMDPLEGLTTNKEMYEYVLGVFKGDKAFLDVTGQLLWIKRAPGEFWKAPR